MTQEQVKQAANEIVEKHHDLYDSKNVHRALVHAIATVEYAIGVLFEIQGIMDWAEVVDLNAAVQYQQALLTELKSRI